MDILMLCVLPVPSFLWQDLAARNVLVSNEEVCKVADMGLLREVDEQDLYMEEVSTSRGGVHHFLRVVALTEVYSG